MPYCERAVAAKLAPWVECVWHLTTNKAISSYPVRPDGCVDIVYSDSTGLAVAGAMTVEQRFSLAAGSEVFGLRFRPGMSTVFLRVNARELTDCSVPLEEFWGSAAREVQWRMADCDSIAGKVQLLGEALQAPTVPPDHFQRALAA